MNHLTASWSRLAVTERPAGQPRDAKGYPGSRVLEIPGGALQFSVGNEADPAGATIHAVYVDPQARRQGIATQLLDALAKKFAGHAVDPGGLTDDGAPLWHHWVAANGWPEVNGIVWLMDEDEFYGDDE